MSEAVLALGSNLGNRVENIQKSLGAISRLPDTHIVKISGFYETEPFQVPEPQEDFINCCVKVNTRLQPHTLLGACLGIEADIGRVRTHKNAARVIDIDLLFYGNVICRTGDLILPHPRIRERAFVMVPLRDIYPDAKAPRLDFSKALSQMDTSGVKRMIK